MVLLRGSKAEQTHENEKKGRFAFSCQSEKFGIKYSQVPRDLSVLLDLLASIPLKNIANMGACRNPAKK